MKTPATLLDSYRNEEGRILLGGFLWVLGTFFFFWFLGSLRARLAAAEGRVQRLTAIAFGGGVAAAVALRVPALGARRQLLALERLGRFARGGRIRHDDTVSRAMCWGSATGSLQLSRS